MANKKVLLALTAAFGLGSLGVGLQSASIDKEYVINKENIEAIAGVRARTIESFLDEESANTIDIKKVSAKNIIKDLAKKESLAKKAEEKQVVQEDVKEEKLTYEYEIVENQAKEETISNNKVEEIQKTPVQEDVQPVAEAEEVKEDPGLEVEESQEVAKDDQEEVSLTGFTTDELNIRSEASNSAEILGSMASGAKLTGEQKDGWIKINFNGMPAYVSSDFVSLEPKVEEVALSQILDEEVEEVEKVEEVVAEPEIEAKETEEEATEEETVEVAVAKSPEAPTGTIQGLLEDGLSLVGRPYVWGGSSLDGFDCSGLTSYLFQKHFGTWIGRVTTAQLEAGYSVGIEGMEPGDLVLFQAGEACDHVGIYIGNGSYLHAADESRGVVIDSIEGSYFQNCLIDVRRIVD